MSNLVKFHTLNIEESEKRILDMNELVERRIIASIKKQKTNNDASVEGEEFSDGFSGGFTEGLAAETLEVDALLQDGDTIIKAQTPVMDQAVIEDMLAQAQAEAEQIIAQAQMQADEIIRGAQNDAMAEADNIMANAQNQGYAAGKAAADEELRAAMAELENERAAMEAEYQEALNTMEPALVETITDIYKQIFEYDLSKEKSILTHIIQNTLRKIDGGRSFLIHVSKDDYSFTSMHKKELEECVIPGSELEIIEDFSLLKGDCMIETDGGIFDCGLGTELDELGQKLRLLSYERGR